MEDKEGDVTSCLSIVRIDPIGVLEVRCFWGVLNRLGSVSRVWPVQTTPETHR